MNLNLIKDTLHARSNEVLDLYSNILKCDDKTDILLFEYINELIKNVGIERSVVGADLFNVCHLLAFDINSINCSGNIRSVYAAPKIEDRFFKQFRCPRCFCPHGNVGKIPQMTNTPKRT
ncbi:MAG: hypothetical protein QM666_03730 [Acinetobacter sp.]